MSEIQQALFPGSSDEEDEVTELEDGSAIVREKNVPNAAESKHYANLAEKMSETERQEIATELLDLIEEDKKAREKRDQQYEDGLKRTGASEPAPGGADFEGASRATHPLLLEACIDFSASSLKEIHPADGPCKIKIVGDYDRKLLDRAERIRDYMNWQMTTEIAEYEDVLDETLSQVPLAGSQYMKWWWGSDRNRPRCEFFPADKVYIPFSESSFYETRRLTLVLDLTEGEYAARVRSGMYRDVNDPASQEPKETKAQEAANKIEGKASTGMNVDGTRRCYEVYWEHEFEEGQGPLPYIVTVDENMTTLLAVRRNWEEGDRERKKMDWVIEWPFIRWRGAMSLGLIHVIGGLSVAATGALRALLDSGHVNTVPSGIMLKGVGNVNAQSVSVPAGAFAKVDAPPGIDDIRKAAMPFPFNPPSPILFELLGFLTTAGKGVVGTAEEKIADINAQTPVGTTMAFMEQGGKVFSAIHKRMHKACYRTLMIVYRLNRMYLTKERVIEDLGRLVVRPDDFNGPSPIVPVSDPNIFCEGQRYAQMQGVMQLAMTQPPGEWDIRKINERWLQLMRVPDGDDLLMKRPEPKETNPVAENMGMALGQPAAAFPLQDHFAHIQSHVLFLRDPAFGQNPLIAPGMIPLMAEHLKQHLVMAYAKMMYEAGSKALGEPLETVMKEENEAVRVEFDKLMATVAVAVAQQGSSAFQGLMPVFQELAQMVQSMKPPQPMDPSAVQMAEVERKKAKDAADAQAKQQDQQTNVASLQDKRDERMQKLAAEQEKERAKLADAERARAAEAAKERGKLIAQEHNERRKAEETRRKTVIQAEIARQDRMAEDRRAAAKIEADLEMNSEDNEVAIAIAKARAADKDDSVGGMSSGKGVTNP